MKQEIEFFKVSYSPGSRDNLIIGALELLLSNVQKNNITLTFIDQQGIAQHELSPAKMYKQITENKSVTLLLTKDDLIARVIIMRSFIKLFPEIPLKMKLHRDEINASVDYIEYLKMLLMLCEDLEIDSLAANESLPLA